MKRRLREKNKDCYEGGVQMDTRFEINIKRLGIKGDDKALYLFFDGNLTLKLEYKDVEYAVNYLVKRANRQRLSPANDKSSLPITAANTSEDDE